MEPPTNVFTFKAAPVSNAGKKALIPTEEAAFGAPGAAPKVTQESYWRAGTNGKKAAFTPPAVPDPKASW